MLLLRLPLVLLLRVDHGHADIVKLLLSHGAEGRWKNRRGVNSIHGNDHLLILQHIDLVLIVKAFIIHFMPVKLL